jgi:iron(III) transport system substrate-binding protein
MTATRRRCTWERVDGGQGNRVALTSPTAAEFAIPTSDIRLVMGDTACGPADLGTFGSRSPPVCNASGPSGTWPMVDTPLPNERPGPPARAASRDPCSARHARDVGPEADRCRQFDWMSPRRRDAVRSLEQDRTEFVSGQYEGYEMINRKLASGIAFVALAAAACGASTHNAGNDPHHGSVVPLVVYSAQGYDHAETAAFQRATGIPVHLDDNSTGPLLTQIEASRNNPNWGLLWVDGATAFAELDRQGLLIHGFEPSVSWNSLGRQSVPQDGAWVPTGVTLMAAMVYDKTKVAAPPTSWQQLLSAQWKGAVGMNDPSQSGPTFPFIAGMMQALGGVSQGKHYFSQLKANGLVIHPTNGPTLQALASGQIKLALVQSSAGIGARFTDKNLVVRYLNPVTLLPSAIGIDAKAPAAEIAEAKRFVEFVLSPAGQRVMQSGDPQGDSLYYPVLTGVSPLPALPALMSVHVQSLNPYTWGPREPAINSWFDSTIVQ